MGKIAKTMSKIDQTSYQQWCFLAFLAGLVASWNSANPSERVLPGDRIIKLNGEEKAGPELVQGLREVEKIELMVLKYA